MVCSTVNPIMGCAGCELFPPIGSILEKLDEALHSDEWEPGKSRSVFKQLVKTAYDAIPEPGKGHKNAVTTTNLWLCRELFEAEVKNLLGETARIAAHLVIKQQITCYAAKLHLNKGFNILKPDNQAKKGYAPTFEQLTHFEGRVAEMAAQKDLLGKHDPDRPWIDHLPRLIFVSDMGDALSRESDFPFLKKEVIQPIQSEEGKRHLWLWLTKRPELMADFAREIGGLPKNVCAMTTVTGPDKLMRIGQHREVPATVRGLPVEPLWSRIPPIDLDLRGIS